MLAVNTHAELAVAVEMQAGQPPADGEAMVLSVRGDKLGVGIKLKDFTTALLADQKALASDVYARITQDQASAYAVLGYGPDAKRLAKIVDDRLQEAAGHPMLSIKIGVHEREAFVVRADRATERRSLDQAITVRDQYTHQLKEFGAYAQPSFTASAYDLRSQSCPPSQAVMNALDTLDQLGCGEQVPARALSAAAALLTDDVSRDLIILRALDHETLVEGMNELYRRAPVELQGELGTVAAFTNMTVGRRQHAAGTWAASKDLPAPKNQSLKDRVGLVLERNLYLPDTAASLKLAEEPLQKRLHAADQRWNLHRTQARAISVEQAQTFTVYQPALPGMN